MTTQALRFVAGIILVLVLALENDSYANDESCIGSWKVISVTGNTAPILNWLRALTLTDDKAVFVGEAGEATAELTIASQNDGGKVATFRGSPKLNGGDLSFVGVAKVKVVGELLNLSWVRFEMPAGRDESDIETDMWLAKMPETQTYLQGSWRVAWSSRDGEVGEPLGTDRWTFDGNRLIVEQAKGRNEYRFEAISYTVPYSVSRIIVNTENIAKSKVEYGILRVDNGSIWIAFSANGAEAPSDFVSRQGTKVTLVNLTRSSK